MLLSRLITLIINVHPGVQPRQIGRMTIDGLWKDLFSHFIIVLRFVCHESGQASRVLLDAGTQTNPFIHDVNQQSTQRFRARQSVCGQPDVSGVT